MCFCFSGLCLGQTRGLDSNTLDPETHSLVKSYCRDCHGGKAREGEIDFNTFNSIEDARGNLEVWLKVRQVLDSRQMPPPEAPQPTEAEFSRLRSWTHSFLKAEAAAKAGDPGPVLLRRLSNAEYDYAIGDLTGLKNLDPARELPVDGAAGEGFTNVGSGQAMSPSLVGKYLDSAKRIAEHLVLLPTGIAFSESTTQRDRTNAGLAEIQAFYRRYTADGGGSSVNLQGIKFETNQGGLLPIRSYLQAILQSRDAVLDGQVTLEQVAVKNGLHERYLRNLWNTLVGKESESFLVEQLRKVWTTAGAEEVDALVTKVRQSQDGFWKFNSIGHVGRQGGPIRWMDPVVPVVNQQELRLPLVKPDNGDDIAVTLTAHDLGDGDSQDFVVWSQPRLVLGPDASGAKASIMLRDVERVSDEVRSIQHKELGQIKRYLDAMLKHLDESVGVGSGEDSKRVPEKQLNSDLLERWFSLIGLKAYDARKVEGLFSNYLSKVQGYDAINGWGVEQTPSMLTNRSDEAISFLTLTIPARSVVVHPSPTSAAVIAWKSPVTGTVKLTSSVDDADNKCGNGVAWRIEHRTRHGKKVVAEGVIDNSGGEDWTGAEPITVAVGDVIALMVLPRDSNHSCDTTHVELKLTEVDGGQRTWDLSEQVVDRVHEGNPMTDPFGHQGVWSFCTSVPAPAVQLPEDSALARWRESAVSLIDTPVSNRHRELSPLADEVHRLVTTDDLETLSVADRELRKLLLDWRGPLGWLDLGRSALEVLQSTDQRNPLLFGLHPNGSKLHSHDLCRRGSAAIQFRIPAEFTGAELVTTARLHADSGVEGSVQVQMIAGVVDVPLLDFGGSFLVHPEGMAGASIKSSVRSFAELFPPALCYSRIVPVDEVVTLRLFHREDDHLSRLMLNQGEIRELDRLWDEFLFVSEEPLKLAVSFEQLSEFATQDRPDLVTAFEPMRVPINRRAEEFKKRRIALEPLQLTAIVNWAQRAWRRQLDSQSQQQLRDFYRRLRDDGMQHPAALKALVTRVLTSPAFLYKLETPRFGTGQSDVDGEELASRLSFFLWSSLPDSQLLDLGRRDRLHDDRVRIQQMRRMLSDPRSKRLAEQFACQWLHLRDFDRNDDKNERLYPEFAALRGSMYGETLRFFEDMFQNNGSILDLVDANHTFVDQALADHYGLRWNPDRRVEMELSDDPAWQRVEGVRSKGRGGILGMAAFLASQSGASRTSPILRGNWIYETLLGEHLPRPPADVPSLPEEVPDGLTARQLIAKHSSVKACAKCHAHIDPFGFALEEYDALGRLRETGADTTAKLMNGQVMEGAAGLRRYLVETRREEVVRQFCRKLLGFALGREVLLSDEPLLDRMHMALSSRDYRFQVAVEHIINSRQFCQIRDQPSTIQP